MVPTDWAVPELLTMPMVLEKAWPERRTLKPLRLYPSPAAPAVKVRPLNGVSTAKSLSGVVWLLKPKLSESPATGGRFGPDQLPGVLHFASAPPPVQSSLAAEAS